MVMVVTMTQFAHHHLTPHKQDVARYYQGESSRWRSLTIGNKNMPILGDKGKPVLDAEKKKENEEWASLRTGVGWGRCNGAGASGDARRKKRKRRRKSLKRKEKKKIQIGKRKRRERKKKNEMRGSRLTRDYCRSMEHRP
jgi:hypothetical protein